MSDDPDDATVFANRVRERGEMISRVAALGLGHGRLRYEDCFYLPMTPPSRDPRLDFFRVSPWDRRRTAG